jgi:predicted O-methyltransferase YrrM
MIDLSLSFNMAGTEEVFNAMFQQAIRERATVAFHYLEIGIATGNTLAQAANEARASTHTFRCTGIDLVDSEYFNAKEFLRKTLAHEVSINFSGVNQKPFVADTAQNNIVVLLLKSPDVRAIISPKCINFALIDGCHGSKCVFEDFYSIESGIAPNGIVAFHDAMPEDQGKCYQKHCHEAISVREALRTMNLIDHLTEQNKACRQPGWKCLGYVSGDKEKDGNGFVFFQKIEKQVNAYQEGFTG